MDRARLSTKSDHPLQRNSFLLMNWIECGEYTVYSILSLDIAVLQYTAKKRDVSALLGNLSMVNGFVLVNETLLEYFVNEMVKYMFVHI